MMLDRGRRGDGWGEETWLPLVITLLAATPVVIGWIWQRRQERRATKESKQMPVNIIPTEPIQTTVPQVGFPELESVSGEESAISILDTILERDITAQARRGELYRIYGRTAEIQQLATLLGGIRPTNVLLVGESGIGKTALVEGLAQAICEGNATRLRGYDILEFRAESFASRRHSQGTQAELIRAFVDEVSDREIIAFFDDIHCFMHMSLADEGSTSLASMIRPALSARRIRCIAATRPSEYRQYVEPDRRFVDCFLVIEMHKRDRGQPFGELSLDQTYRILDSRARILSEEFGVSITHTALEAAISLSEKYMPDQRFPGKALHLIEESAKRLSIRPADRPWELIRLEDTIDALNAKLRRLEDEDAADTVRDRQQIREELERLQRQRQLIMARWQNFERTSRELVQTVQEMAHAMRALRSAELNQDTVLIKQFTEDVTRLKDQRWRLQQELEPIQTEFQGMNSRIDMADIAGLVQEITGIPVTIATEEEERLRHMEDYLHKRVIGQDEAIKAVAAAIRRARKGVSRENAPIGSFLFVGPTGVGKTELAKGLAEFLFGTERALIRLDMSEYMEPHTVYRMIGAPPGYVGYEEGGQLTESIRQRPYSVVLLDEVEKAHPRVFDVLLQVLDDARLTDGQGKTADFQHAIIIMTSNIGSDLIKREGLDAAKEALRAEIERIFRPEFINRLDDIIFFHPLSIHHVAQILDIIAKQWARDQASRLGLSIELTEGARQFIVEQGYNPVYGARFLRRKWQEMVVDHLVGMSLNSELHPGDLVRIDVSEGKLMFNIIPSGLSESC